MKNLQKKLTSQGQVSVPAALRKHLHLIPGSVLVWTQEGERVVVERAKPARGLSDCLGLEIARKAGHLPLATFDKALARVSGGQKL